ncbi:ATP-binding protein [Dechloromonas sp. HYN0024]|uniref:ATP-binding protein n=1 Tax=Dechloromonas sp. HYN0024 TaxID=2231055 RepID=UPI000E451D5C|nr:ATP-binding protein [Dechloromonas sp. HYN0024]AXS79615.1 sensor histidine kinase [Dechloromonas sp. HYN0024]
MAITLSTTANSDHLANLRRLVLGRWAVLAVLAQLILVGPGLLDIPVPQTPLLGIVAIAGLFNGLAQWRTASARTATTGEIFSHLLFDVGILSAVVFLSGGAANPLVSLLLPPVAVAALTLPGRWVATITTITIAAYSLLMVYYIPLPMADATRATRLHLGGMWLIFVVSTVMIGWVIVRTTRIIRQRDAELATAREQGLRDERVMAMGTLAAGAAHELGTPLGTMALLAGELANEAGLSPAAQEDIALLRQQIGVCKQIITGLSRRAGAERLENSPLQAADQWLAEVRQHWHAARPQASSRLIVTSDGTAPDIVADPRLEQAVLNLLNNAANATASPLDIRLGWSTEILSIDIRDHGPGFPPEVLELGGQASFPAHERGSGVGLMLTRSAVEQLGGSLTLANPDDGGALARIELPRTKT